VLKTASQTVQNDRRDVPEKAACRRSWLEAVPMNENQGFPNLEKVHRKSPKSIAKSTSDLRDLSGSIVTRFVAGRFARFRCLRAAIEKN
jgi:hypothetical protein